MSTSTNVNMDFKEYLLSLKKKEEDKTKNDHVVVGNRAGDADSIISALTLAYVESVYGGTPKTPMVSITQRDLETQRPEVSFLFQTSGLDNTVIDSLRYIDDPTLSPSKVTLVDHNRAEPQFQACEVVEIVDHHYDEQQHLDTCEGESRNIAFQDDKATVASTCTLVAERLQQLNANNNNNKQPQQQYPSTLSSLLLGTILLDSVNMIPQAGKGTPRDAAAIQNLLDHTDWSTSTPEAKAAWWAFYNSFRRNGYSTFHYTSIL